MILTTTPDTQHALATQLAHHQAFQVRTFFLTVMLISGVVLLWAGGWEGPPTFGSDYSKSRVWAPQYLRQKGPRIILDAWAPQYQKHDYTPVLISYPIP